MDVDDSMAGKQMACTETLSFEGDYRVSIQIAREYTFYFNSITGISTIHISETNHCLDDFLAASVLASL